MKKRGVMERLQGKYHLQERGLCYNRGTETEINSKGQQGEVKRYQGRVTHYSISRTDCLSITDISCDGDAQKEQETSDADAAIGFWG